MKKIRKNILLIGILIAISIVLLFFNYKTSNFWKVTLKDIITFDFAIFFTYYLTESKQDQRIKNEKLNHIIEDISKSIDEVSQINFQIEYSNKQFTLLIRKVNNKINVLKELNNGVIDESKITYIIEQIGMLDSFVSEHIKDVEYLDKSRTTIEMHVNNIENKCDEIFVDVFK